MHKAQSQKSKSEIITVGDLISELCRWPDHAAVTFWSPLQPQHFRFCRIATRAKGTVEIELEQASESPPIMPA
jgi:hypothetical protein